MSESSSKHLESKPKTQKGEEGMISRLSELCQQYVPGNYYLIWS
jgi:hypothetical protein